MINLTGREIIKAIMQENGITNAEMATRLNLSQAALWERLNNTKTRDIPLSTFTKMLQVLDCEVLVTSSTTTYKVTVKEGSNNMAMKKWKICVGICGPRLLWTNIIKAVSPEEAVKKYLGDDYENTDQKTIDSLIEHCHEHVPQKRES